MTPEAKRFQKCRGKVKAILANNPSDTHDELAMKIAVMLEEIVDRIAGEYQMQIDNRDEKIERIEEQRDRAIRVAGSPNIDLQRELVALVERYCDYKYEDDNDRLDRLDRNRYMDE
jgi:hypothetical protein